MNTEKIEGWTPFKQIPIIEDQEVFTITGAQLKTIQSLFEAYTPLVNAFEKLFVESLENGKITIRYEDLQGNPMEKDEIENMLQRYAEEVTKNMTKEE